MNKDGLRKVKEGNMGAVKLRICLLLLVGVFLCAGAMSAQATIVSDEYYGAMDYGHGDVIGDVNVFGISEADVNLAGSIP